MSLRLSEILRRGGKPRGLAARSIRRRPILDLLEARVLLSNVAPLWKPTSTNLGDTQNGPMANAGAGLINLYENYASYVANGSQGIYAAPSSTPYLVHGDTVAVDVVGWGDQSTFVAKLDSLGMAVGGVDSTHEIAEGWLPIGQLPAVAEMNQVVDLSGIQAPVFYQEGSAPNQSDRTLLADAARSEYGVDGTGVKIGVLSDSVNQSGGGLATSEASGDLPKNVQVIDDSSVESDTDEGRAMLEEIYDIAPGASLAFATAYPAATPGDVGMANNIKALAAAGCTVIIDDVGLGDEPFFQSSVVGDAIDQVTAEGVTYLSAEGNSGSGGGYASQFRAVTANVPGIGSGSYMNFNAGTGAAQTSIPFTLTQPGGDLDLQWDNPFYVTNGVTTQLDLYLIDPTTGSVVASARSNSIANDQPIQNLDTSSLAAGTYNMVVRVAKGAAPSYIEVLPLDGIGSIAQPSSGSAGGTFFPSAWGHATDPNNIGVGAVAWWDASPYDGSINPTPNEPFSSSGPSLSIFSDAGVRQTATAVQTPVISGAEGNDISFSLDGSGDISTLAGQTPNGEPGTPTELDEDGLPNFFGTSAAVPNVAAVVALMKESNPAATPSEIKDSLIESAVPLNGASAGAYDPQGGYGLVQATTALRSIDDHLSVTVSPPSGVYELQPITNYVIGTFTDPGATGGAAAFTATVNWGDGNVVPAQVTLVGNTYEVTASDTYALGGTYTVTVTVDHTGYSTRTGSASIVIIPYPISLTAPDPDPSTYSLEEGQTLRGTGMPLAELVDSLPVPSSASDYTATITWSDGTTSPATVVPVVGQTNTYMIDTVKNFQAPGDYTFSISVTDPGTASASFSDGVTVADAPLLPGAAVTLSPTEGQIFSGTVVKFIDQAYANGEITLPLSDYSATVSWGDGQSSLGLVQNDPNVAGGFIVVASHRYTTFTPLSTPYTLSVTINDLGVPTNFPAASVTITSLVTVKDASLASQGTSFGLTEGTAFNGTAATFQSGDPSAPIGDFSVSIDWGDGTAPDTSATIVSTGQGGYRVQANHIYINPGTFVGTATIDDAGGNSTQATITATVKDAPITMSTSGLVPITTVEGTAFSGTVATLIDANIYATLAQYQSVTIDWGDGTTSNLGDATNPVQIIAKQGGPAGQFVISDTHTYTHFGTYAITTSAVDVGGSTASATLGASATAATIVASGVSPIQAQLGIAYTGPVATIYDSNPTPLASDFSAVINWGDGTSSGGNVTENTDGSFSVAGSHIYQVPFNSSTITVTVNDAAGQNKTVTDQIKVADASLTPYAVVVSPTPTEGSRFNALVGQFTDSNPNPNLSTLSATIDWGDNTPTSTGTIQLDNGKYDVRGQHLYAAGSYEITVTVNSAYGASTTIVSTVSVQAATLTSTPPSPITLTQGIPFNGTTLVFSSTNPTATASDFSLVEIDWGDGTVTNGTVTIAAGNLFDVSGSHTYNQVGAYPITTTVESDSGSSTTQVLTATVQDASLSVKSTGNFATKVGSNAAVTLASIVYGDTSSTTADFTASINWGDGTVTSGTVVPDTVNGAGHFLVMGSHGYAAVGSYGISVAVNDTGGNSESTSLTASVGDAAITVTSQPLSAVANSTVSGQVATFSSANPAATAASFSATINWGDGTLSSGTISPIAAELYGVSGSHIYKAPGTDLVVVTITSNGGSSASTSQQIAVAVQTQQITAQLTASTISGTNTGLEVATKVNQPVFAGSGAVGNIITITGQRAGLAIPQKIAQTTVGSNGTWSVASTTLLDGSYTIVASATDGQGNVTSSPVTLPILEVDTIAPKVTGVTLNPKTGQAMINIQDDLSGLLVSQLTNAANYTLTLPTAKGTETIAITGITVSSGGATDTRVVTLNFATNSKRPRLGVLVAGKYTLTINGNNLTDAAGNILSETFFSLPSSTKANTGYVAEFVTNGHAIASPQTVTAQKVKVKTVKIKSITVSSTPKPRPTTFHKAR